MRYFADFGSLTFATRPWSGLSDLARRLFSRAPPPTSMTPINITGVEAGVAEGP